MRPADSQAKNMQELGLKDIRLLEQDQTSNLTIKKYDVKIKTGEPDTWESFKLYIYDWKDRISVLAYRGGDASLEYSFTKSKNESVNPFRDALSDILSQIHRASVREQGEEAIRRAQEKTKEGPSTADQVINVLQTQLAPQLGLLALSAFTNSGMIPEPKRDEEHRRLPSQDFMARRAQKVAEAEKEAEKENDIINSALTLRASAELQTNWSWKYLDQDPSFPVRNDVTASLEKHGFKEVSIYYTPEAIKLYRATLGNRLVEFTILPGGMIHFMARSLIAKVNQPSMGFTINIVDTRRGDFRAENLDDAIGQLTAEAQAPLNEARQFMYSPIPGIAPLDVTGSQIWPDLTLPYPIQTNIPPSDYRIPLPIGANEWRSFLYRPLRSGATIPNDSNRRWYEFGRKIEPGGKR